MYVGFGVRPELWSPPFAYIDIFILDGSPDNKFLRAFKQHTVELVAMIMKARVRIDAKNFKKPKLWFIFMPIAVLLSGKKWKELLDRISQWWSDDKYSTLMYQCYNICVSAIKYLYPKRADVWKVVRTDYEGYDLPIPAGWEELLKISYGDFMIVPNHENIHVHSIVEQLDDSIIVEMRRNQIKE